MLIRIETPSLQECSSGGRIIHHGLDNGENGGTERNGILEDGEIDYTTNYCSKFVVRRLLDINLGSLGSGMYDLTVLDTRIYFGADDGVNGLELWTYETTNGSAWMISDINPGPQAGYSSQIGDFSTGITVLGGRLYFSGNDGSSGIELWVHDTDNESTWLVADINSGERDANVNFITTFGSRLYFQATDGVNGSELWAHETTNDSTWQVDDIWPGSAGSGAHSITSMGNWLFFSANGGKNGFEMWGHNTSSELTWQLMDLGPGSSGGFPWDLIVLDDLIYFSAGGGNLGTELWKYNPEWGGIYDQIIDLYPGSNSGLAFGKTVLGTRLYFMGIDSTGDQLWAYETTNDSTWRISNFQAEGSGWRRVLHITAVGSRLYFQAYNGDHGLELWVHDTITESTWEVEDINQFGNSDINQFGNSEPGKNGEMVTIDGRLYFDADDGIYGRELWMMEIETSISYL